MLKINDLVEGEIYVTNYPGQGDYIFKSNGDNKDVTYLQVDRNSFSDYGDMSPGNGFKSYKLPTDEQKHWFLECEKVNKFISYEEAMKTFIQKFKTGKWYKLGEWISKFSHLKNNEFWGENICMKDNYRDPLGWLDLDAYTPKLITNLEEIQQYLPANHPDKVSNSLIGRYLKALINAPFSIGRANKGDYFIILDDFIQCKLVKDSSTWAYKEKNEKINPEVWELMPVGFCPNQVDIKEWSVGSYAVLLNDSKSMSGLKKGFIDVIEENDTNEEICFKSYCTYNIIDLSYQDGDEFKWFATKSEAEEFSKTLVQPIKEKPMETNNEFKVGDWVIGWHANYKKYQTEAWQIEKITASQLVPKNDSIAGTGLNNIKRAELHEIPTKDLSNEELLSIAKTYYPIGTKFQPIYGGKISSIVEENNHLFGKSNSGDVIVVTTDNGDGQMLKNSTAIWSKEKGFAKIISSPNEIKGIKPSDEIEIGDEVEVTQRDYEFGKKGIVQSYHTTNYFDISGLKFPYNKDQLKLIRKANNTTTLTQTKKDDVLSPKVENKVTVQIIEREIKNPILNISVQEENQSIFVPLIQKETKKINNITIKNFSLTV